MVGVPVGFWLRDKGLILVPGVPELGLSGCLSVHVEADGRTTRSFAASAGTVLPVAVPADAVGVVLSLEAEDGGAVTLRFHTVPGQEPVARTEQGVVWPVAAGVESVVVETATW
ncbi:hypothetical protein, partial [Azospirillum sp. B506]|uniref:hypothetical protein n=1 Tax=Azospirillum sp. B506 TaxID=137721 RepID=UPI0005B284F2